jgi:hypothetical protein
MHVQFKLQNKQFPSLETVCTDKPSKIIYFPAVPLFLVVPMKIVGKRETYFFNRNVSVNDVSGIRFIISNKCNVYIRFIFMCISNRKWSKGKCFNVIQSQIDYLLGSVLCTLLITTEPKSRFSYVTAPNSNFYSLIRYRIPVTLNVP